MNSPHALKDDATQFAGMAYQSMRAMDGTLGWQAGYQSILSTSVPEPESEPERYQIGDMIGGRYEVLAIHLGSMGVVYGTFDHEEKLPRALKTIQRRFAGSKGMADLFKEEAAVWVRLEKHPFIVRAYLVQNIEAQPYVITEYIRGHAGMGGDLRAWLGNPKLTLPVAVEMALQIAQGMQHAGRKIPGMVHRDLKPANILVDDRARAMVTDFGLVYAADASAGTPAYMAPEQWRGETLEPRTDIYAFGCILYEMFTGHRMFAADSVQEWKSAHLSLLPVSPRDLNPALPDELEVLVLRCLAKDLHARPGTWDDVVAECAHWFHQMTGQPAVLEFNAYDLTVSELITASYSLSQLGKYSDQIELCDRALAIDPNNAVAWDHKGFALGGLGWSEEAVAAYGRAVTIDSKYVRGWKNKGYALHSLSRNEEAVVSYGRALAINPGDRDACYSMGVCLNELGRNEEALAAYDRALAIHPDFAMAWSNKGIALGRLGRNEEAVAAYDRALAINPDDRDACYDMGIALNELGRNEEAVAAYERALAIDPNYANAWSNKGNALFGLGRKEAAVAAYDRALAIDPQRRNTSRNKGVVLDDLGRKEEAVAAYDQSLATDPNDAMAWHYKGNALSDLGRNAEAVTAYDWALAIDPNFALARNNKRLALKALTPLGRLEEAVAAYNRAALVIDPNHVIIDPNHAGARSNKGAALKALDGILPRIMNWKFWKRRN